MVMVTHLTRPGSCRSVDMSARKVSTTNAKIWLILSFERLTTGIFVEVVAKKNTLTTQTSNNRRKKFFKFKVVFLSFWRKGGDYSIEVSKFSN